MAFEIGERVTSTWTGPGTIVGPLVRVKEDESDVLGVPHQRVKLDKPLFGETEVLRPIAKLQPYVDPPKKKPRSVLDEPDPADAVRKHNNPEFPPPALLGPFDNVQKVRVLASELREGEARDLFTRLGIDFPGDWRGCAKGKRGGHTAMWGISAVVTFKDGHKVNDARLILRTLSEGRAQGWRITESV